MIKPLHKNVVLKKEKAEKEKLSAGGIILMNNDKNKPEYATVVAVGPESAADIKINDKVIYKEYSGTNVKMDDEEYIIVEDEDILAVLA